MKEYLLAMCGARVIPDPGLQNFSFQNEEDVLNLYVKMTESSSNTFTYKSDGKVQKETTESDSYSFQNEGLDVAVNKFTTSGVIKSITIEDAFSALSIPNHVAGTLETITLLDNKAKNISFNAEYKKLTSLVMESGRLNKALVNHIPTLQNLTIKGFPFLEELDLFDISVDELDLSGNLLLNTLYKAGDSYSFAFKVLNIKNSGIDRLEAPANEFVAKLPTVSTKAEIICNTEMYLYTKKTEIEAKGYTLTGVAETSETGEAPEVKESSETNEGAE